MFDSFLQAQRVFAAYLSLTAIQEESTFFNIQFRNLHMDVAQLQFYLSCSRCGIQSLAFSL